MNSSLDGDEDLETLADASRYAVCICLVQQGKLIFYVSKVLNKSQRRWPIIMKEMYAISWGNNELRIFLLGKKFKIKTDHKPLYLELLKRLMPSKMLSYNLWSCQFVNMMVLWNIWKEKEIR